MFGEAVLSFRLLFWWVAERERERERSSAFSEIQKQTDKNRSKEVNGGESSWSFGHLVVT